MLFLYKNDSYGGFFYARNRLRAFLSRENFLFFQFFPWGTNGKKIEFSKSSLNRLIFLIFRHGELEFREFFDFDHWKLPLPRVYSKGFIIKIA